MSRFALISAALGAVFFAPACGPSPTAVRGTEAPLGVTLHDPEPAKEAIRRLDTGLEIIAIVDPGSPVIVAHLHIAAGAAHGATGREAAVLEALVSDPAAELAAAIEAIGGHLDSWTTRDTTVYEVTIAPAALGAAVDSLATAISTPAINPDRVSARCKSVARRHAALRRDPARDALDLAIDATYGEHPLGRRAAGFEAGTAAPDAAALRAWHSAWYRPSRARLVLAGGIHPDRDLDRAEKALRRWTVTGGEPPADPLAAEPETEPGPTIRFVRRDDGASWAWLALPIGRPSLAEAAMLDLASAALAAPDDGRLARAARRSRLVDPQPAVQVYAPDGPGALLVGIGFRARRAGDVERAWGALVDAVFGVAGAPLDAAELNRARGALRRDALAARASPGATAARRAALAARWPGAGGEPSWRRAIDATDAKAATRALTRYANPARIAGGIRARVEPDPEAGSQWPQAFVDRAIGAADAPPPPRPMSTRVHRIDPLTTVAVLPENGTGVVAIHAIAGPGRRAEPSHTPGVADLTAALMAAAGDDRVPMTAETGPDGLHLRVSVTADAAERAIARLAAALSAPTVNAESLFAARRAVRLPRDMPPTQRVERWFAEALYGAHPYSRALIDPQLLGAHMDTVGRIEIENYYDAHVAAAEWTIAVVGDIEPSVAIDWLTGAVPQRDASETGDRRPIDNRLPPIDTARRVDRRDGGGAVVMVGFRGFDGRAAGRHAAALLVEVWAADATAELRRRGVTTGRVEPRLFAGIDGGHVAIRLETPPGTSEMSREAAWSSARQLRNNGTDVDAIASARRRLAGRRAVALSTSARRAARLARETRLGRADRGPHLLARWASAVEPVGRAELKELATRLFTEEAYVEVLLDTAGPEVPPPAVAPRNAAAPPVEVRSERGEEG